MHLSFESYFEYDLFISKFSEHYYLMTRTLIMLLCLFFPFHIISEELNGENLLFIPPDDYQMGFSDRKNDMFISEWFLDGQTQNDWSEMVTVQVFYNYPTREINNFQDKFIGVIVDTCEDGRGLSITSGEEYGYSFNFFMTICGKNPNTQKPEYTMIKVISGSDALYIIQKAWKYEPSDAQIQDWSKSVSRVFLCDSRNVSAPCPKL